METYAEKGVIRYLSVPDVKVRDFFGLDFLSRKKVQQRKLWMNSEMEVNSDSNFVYNDGACGIMGV